MQRCALPLGRVFGQTVLLGSSPSHQPCSIWKLDGQYLWQIVLTSLVGGNQALYVCFPSSVVFLSALLFLLLGSLTKFQNHNSAVNPDSTKTLTELPATYLVKLLFQFSVVLLVVLSRKTISRLKRLNLEPQLCHHDTNRIGGGCHRVPHTALRFSDRSMVHLIFAYRQKPDIEAVN